jgi:HEPN domain-containing protein
MAGAQFNPLSVSVTAERLLYRAKHELESGDYTLSIVIGTMAVESFLTRLFFKVKGMDCYAATFTWPTEAQEKAWENEYPRKGGFTGPADFVSKATVAMSFDKFATTNVAAKTIMNGFPDAGGTTPKQYFQSQLFYPRNRIAHWGYVNTTKDEAERCLRLAIAIVSLFRIMDRIKYGNL